MLRNIWCRTFGYLGNVPQGQNNYLQSNLTVVEHGRDLLAIEVHGWMDGWMDGRTDGRMDGWMDGWMEESAYAWADPSLRC